MHEDISNLDSQSILDVSPIFTVYNNASSVKAAGKKEEQDLQCYPSTEENPASLIRMYVGDTHHLFAEEGGRRHGTDHFFDGAVGAITSRSEKDKENSNFNSAMKDDAELVQIGSLSYCCSPEQ